MITHSPDPLLTAAKLAVAGNSIDFGVQMEEIDLEKIISDVLSSSFAIDDYPQFLDAVTQSSRIVYLGDNAGEIVFDRLFIEQLMQKKKVEISFVVRGAPIINDATIDDARMVGMDKVVKVISNGSDAPATLINDMSAELTDHLQRADMVIAKGQGNYEAWEEVNRKTCFICKGKMFCHLPTPGCRDRGFCL
jgi:hypothetical protein